MRITKYKTLLNEDGLLNLVKETSNNYATDKYLDSSKKVADMLNTVFQLGEQSEEYVYMICFNSKMKVLGVFEISHGAVNYTVSNPREIFIKALMCNAVNVILAHNHPSQDTEPSRDDIKTYERVKKAGEIIGINLLDSIIVTKLDHLSLRERGV